MIFPARKRGSRREKSSAIYYKYKTHCSMGNNRAAIRAFDYMDGTSNNYGVHTVTLEVIINLYLRV